MNIVQLISVTSWSYLRQLSDHVEDVCCVGIGYKSSVVWSCYCSMYSNHVKMDMSHDLLTSGSQANVNNEQSVMQHQVQLLTVYTISV